MSLSLLADREVVYFIFGRGCQACAASEPELTAFERKHPGLMVLRLDAGGPIPGELGLKIKLTPTWVYRRGNDAEAKTGFLKEKDIEKWLKSLGASI